MPIISPTLPNDGEDIDASDINDPINAILAVLNGSIDEDNLADGAIILSKLASAVANALVPVGAITPYGGSTAPNSNWLLCYGQAVSRSTYSDLFAVIGDDFGVGDGSTTFNVPDLRGRVPVGSDSIGGTAANRIQRSTTITTTNASASATVASASGLKAGMYVVSANVPAGTTISSISGTTLTLSANATATAAGTAARFSNLANDAQELGAAGGSDKIGSHVHLMVANEAVGTAALLNTNRIASSRNAGGDFSYGIDNAGSNLAASLGISGPTGDGATESNLQPSQITNYIIKV